MVLGSIEAGGTKFVCAIGNHDMEILERISIPTTTPEETLPKVFEFFKKYKRLYQDTLTIILLILAIISIITIFVLISKIFKKLNQ